MAIDILFLNNDFKKMLIMMDGIDSDDNFYYNVRKIAADNKLIFIESIDPYGVTIINKLQLDPLEREINIMRTLPDVNQKTLDILQQAVTTARKLSYYILFSGD